MILYKMILPSFYRYIESTQHLLLYRLDSIYPVPLHLRLPKVHTLVMLHCAPEAVQRFLQPTHFPSLQRIHYLSAAPNDTLLHRRFGTRAEWVFPAFSGDVSYPFYDRMVEGGWGRREIGLVEQYLVCHKPVENGKGKEIETWFDLYLPERCIVDGEWYVQQQMAYLHKKHCDGFHVFCPVQKEYPTDRYRIPAPMETHALMNPSWMTDGVSRGECVERAFRRVVLGH